MCTKCCAIAVSLITIGGDVSASLKTSPLTPPPPPTYFEVVNFRPFRLADAHSATTPLSDGLVVSVHQTTLAQTHTDTIGNTTNYSTRLCN